MQNSKERLWRTLGLSFSLGLSIALPLVAGTLGGRWLDRLLALQKPIFLLAGLLLGLALGLTLVYRKIKAL